MSGAGEASGTGQKPSTGERDPWVIRTPQGLAGVVGRILSRPPWALVLGRARLDIQQG